MNRLRLTILLSMVLFVTSGLKAQFSVGADIVSSYIWRGVPQQTPTPNIQPSVTFTTGNLTVGSWGSSDFKGSLKEVDLFVTYMFSPSFSATITDYDWSFAKNYFDYSASTDHIYEATLSYSGSGKFPIMASVNTMFLGNDKSLSDPSKAAFSTYLELGYQINPLVKVFAGGVLGGSSVYATTSAGLTNVGLKVSKPIVITDKFSILVYGILSANPYSRDAFMVAGISF